MGRVDALEVAERRQQPDADVDGAVADREDPAVPGHRVAVAVLDVERRLDPRVGVAGDGQYVRIAVPYGHSLVRDVPRARPKRLLAPSATIVNSARMSTLEPSWRLTVDAAHEAAVDDRMDRLVALEQFGAGGDGVVGDHRVEVAAPHDVAVAGVHRMARPLQLELPAHPGGPQPVVAVEPLEPAGQAHLVELVHGARGEPVAARLLAGERLALDHRDVVAAPGEPVAGGGAGRPAADDEHVGDEVAGMRRVRGHVGGGGLVDDDGVGGDGDVRQARRRRADHGLGRAALGGGVADVDDLGGAALGGGDAGGVEVGERRARLEGGEHRRLLRAPQLVLLGDSSAVGSGAAEGVALVTHNGEDLGVGEVAAGRVAPLAASRRTTRRVGATLAVGIAVAVTPARL